MEKIIWLRADLAKKAEDRKRLVTTALENNITDIILHKNDIGAFRKLGKINIIQINNSKIIMDGDESVEKTIAIKNRNDQDSAMELVGKTDYILVSSKDWKVIPIENLIAAFQSSKTKLLVEACSAKEAKLFLETLEVGVDGVVLNTTNSNEIGKLRKLIDKLGSAKLKLVKGKITNIKSLGMGDRVCIDTCSILNIGEGMLIGSQASGLFLVHSESIESEYVAARPFRVNAGPVHAYILTPNDKTKYLSDLKAGDEVLAVDRSGETRSVILGRVKIEKRPLVLLEAQYRKKNYNIILQNAETIRLVSGDEVRSIVELSKGDQIMMWVEPSGRHFGMKVEESINEK